MDPAPFHLNELSEDGLDPRPPSGVMAPWLGARFRPEELFNVDRLLLPRVRAYSVPSLVGLRITVPHPRDLSVATRSFLEHHLPRHHLGDRHVARAAAEVSHGP